MKTNANEMAGHFRRAVAEIDNDLAKLAADISQLTAARRTLVELYGGDTELPEAAASLPDRSAARVVQTPVRKKANGGGATAEGEGGADGGDGAGDQRGAHVRGAVHGEEPGGGDRPGREVLQQPGVVLTAQGLRGKGRARRVQAHGRVPGRDAGGVRG